jgi:hypothetical protein
MNITLRERAIGALACAPLAVQKAFIKQMNFLARSLQRFYFTIEDDAYVIQDVVPHPK